MSQSAMRRVALDGVELDVEVRGAGEPVLLIQTALVAGRADHWLALTHPAEVTAAMVAFLRRHPIPAEATSHR